MREDNPLSDKEEIEYARDVASLRSTQFEDAITQMPREWHAQTRPVLLKKSDPAENFRLHFSIKTLNEVLDWLVAGGVFVIVDIKHAAPN